MTVSSTASRKIYSGDDVTTSFSTSPVVFFDTTDLEVSVVTVSTGGSTTLTENTHYTVTGGSGAVGTVSLAGGSSPWGALVSGTKLVIDRQVAATQGTDFVNNDPSDADTLEAALDRLTMIAQQNSNRDDRALRQPTSDATDIAELPSSVSRASKYLAFDANGDPVATAGTTSSYVVTPFAETLLDDTTAAAARATLGALADTAGVVTSGYLASGAVIAAKLAASALGAFVNMVNGAIVTSRAGSAETIAIKTYAGTDPSATDPVYLIFRNVTAGTGDYVVLTVTAALSITIPSTATMGASNNVPFRIWLVAFNDGGTARLGVVNCLSGTNIMPLRDSILASSTLTPASAAQTIYTTGAAVTSKAMRILGYLEYTLATAGTWNTAPTKVQLFGPGVSKPGDVVQELMTATGAVATGTAALPYDDTIPQSSEMTVFMSQAITPISGANILDVQAQVCGAHSVNSQYGTGLFQDSGANALAVSANTLAGAGNQGTGVLRVRQIAGSTSSTTFKAAAAGSAGATFTFNGVGGARQFGGVQNSWLGVKEIMA